MSALAALWRLDGDSARDDLARMMGALHPHGPDDRGSWASGDIAMASLRMRFVPEDLFDRQPLTGGGGRLVLVADLRLDNRAELAAALGLDAERLRRLADAALLLAALEKWGDTAVERLVGPFAFALWDMQKRRLFCARDPLGSRPLFYHRSASCLAVASLPSGILALPEVPKVLDEQETARHLLLLPQSGTSMYAGIERLPPGHTLAVTADGARGSRWWRPPPPGSVRPTSEAALIEQGRALFSGAVEACLRSTGGVGSHLSAGCDSGVVTAVAAGLLARRGQRLTAYTSVPREGYDALGPDGRPGDEGPGAAALAARYANVDHVLFRAGEASPLDDLDLVGPVQGAPVLNACNLVWGNGIARAARARGLSTMLTGQMGNMTISYDGLQRLPSLLLRGLVGTWAREAAALSRSSRQGWKIALRASFPPLMPPWLWRRYSRWRGRDWDPLEYSGISPAFARDIDCAALAAESGWDMGYRPWADGHAMRLAALQRLDLGPVMAAQAAAFRVDHRDPTADRRGVEFCLGLPEEWYLSAGRRKRLLHLLFGDLLPAQTLNPTVRKGYQAVDWHEGLTRARPAIVAELDRLEASPLARRALDLPRLRRLVEDWPEAGWHSRRITHQYRLVLLRALSTGRFIRRVEGGNG